MDTQHNQESLEEVRNNEAAQEGRCPEPLQISSTRATSSNSDIHLIHKRLPKVVVNIQGRSTSLQTPSPIPKNPLRSQQLQEILEPLHLSLLREESGPDSKKFPVPAADSETHLRILQSLIHQTPKVLSLPNLHLKVQELKRGQTESPFPSACRVLQNAQRNFVKTQTLEQDSETWKPHRTLRLSKILESVTRLDASVKLKRRAWMFKPRDGGSAKDKLQAELKFRNALRNQYPPPAESKTLPTDVEEFEKQAAEGAELNSTSSGPGSDEAKSDDAASIESTSTNTTNTNPLDEPNVSDTMNVEFLLNRIESGEGANEESSSMPPPPPRFKDFDESQQNADAEEVEGDGKKPGFTKAELKHSPKKKLSKTRHRVLVLRRKCKIRPGTLFKCRRTKEKFTFTTVHRTITESGLALLTAAYALRSGSIETELQETPHRRTRTTTSCKVSPATLPSCIDPNTSLRELARVSEFVSNSTECAASSCVEVINANGNCYCSKASTSRTTTKCNPKPKPMRITTRKSSLQHPSMVLVNRYTQSLQDSNPETVEFPPPDGIFDHTIELLAYSRELERTIYLLKTESVLVNIGKRPEMKGYLRKPLLEELMPTAKIEKNSLKDVLDQGVCDFLAHAGFSQANLAVVEVLSDVLENYYENLTSRLKAVVEKEVAGVSHGFLDPMDRVTTELGLGGVRGLGDYYERRVIGYHKTVERRVEKLENKLGTLIAFKNLEDSLRTRRPSSSIAERKRLIDRFKVRHYGARLIPKPPN